MHLKITTRLCAMLPLALCTLTIVNAAPALAQKNTKPTPATHMWVKSGLSTLNFIKLRSLKECELFTRQAARLNSAESACYDGEKFLKEFSCTKPVKNGREASCK